MHNVLLLLPSLITLVFACWYAWKIYTKKIAPALSTWLIMALGVLLSIATYLVSSHFNYVGAALNFGDVLCNVIVIGTIFLTQKFTLNFRPFEKWYLLASGCIVMFWIFSRNAFISNLLVQTILIISYLPTVQKLITEKKNTESISAWSICMLATITALYSAFISGNVLSIIYVARSIIMIGIVLILAVYFAHFYKPSSRE